jgi:hypothetical protein
MKSGFLSVIRQISGLLPIGLVFVVLISSMFHNCANIVPPTGGLRDSIPPQIIGSNPPIYSTEILPSRITISFDEFIELRNLQQQFLISPPQAEIPEIKQRGRVLTIDFKSELEPFTTYTLNFGNAIVDLNEGNILSNFEFVFSTGETIDSLTIKGKVLNAFENKPEENVTVMLYPNHGDSVPMKDIPLYVTRTDKEGNFKLRHLRADTFKLFALVDVNNNYLYDRPGSEAIAFLDTLIFPTGADFITQMLADSVQVKQDTIPNKSPAPEGETDQEHEHEHNADHMHGEEAQKEPTILLRLFTEDVAKQYISSAIRPERNRLFFTLNRPSRQEPVIKTLNFSTDEAWKVLESSPENDSVHIWITDTLVSKLDSIQLEISFFDEKPDSVYTLYDTIQFRFAEVEERASSGLKRPSAAADVPFTINMRNNETLELNKTITFSSRRPVTDVDTSKIEFTEIIDSIVTQVPFVLEQDSLFPRRFLLKTSLKEDNQYKLFAEPGAFTDIYKQINDTIQIEFKTQKETAYGSLLLDVKNNTPSVILQLLDDKNNILKENLISEDGLIEFMFLKPQKYRLRVIYDKNNNGKWDTGNYLLGLQPEKVALFKEDISIRAAWELELFWEISFD